jgi:hypothetical protein
MVFIKELRQFTRGKAEWPMTTLSPEQQSPGEIKSISQVRPVTHEGRLQKKEVDRDAPPGP